MAKQLESQVKEVIASVLNIDSSEIKDDASPDNIEKWDSLSHMNIIITLEERFKIRFSDEQIVRMLNYKLMVIMVKEALSIPCDNGRI
jgi:acyl carrier protein